MGIGLAIGAGAAASGVGSIFSGIFGAASSKTQANAIKYSADKAADTALEVDSRARADLAPFRQVGVDASKTLWNILNPNSSADWSALLKQSPLFQYESDIGNRNMQRQIQAQGLGGSGAGLEALSRFNNQLVADESTRWVTNLFNLSTLGSNAAAHMATNTEQAGATASNAYLQGGVAAAGANAQAGQQIAGIGSSLGNLINKGVTDYAGYQMMAPIFNRLAGNVGGGNASTAVPLDLSTFTGG